MRGPLYEEKRNEEPLLTASSMEPLHGVDWAVYEDGVRVDSPAKSISQHPKWWSNSSFQ